ncbi:MAG: hypothetical protein ACRDTX_15020 [Pseudonocardiaceae bacterium]
MPAAAGELMIDQGAKLAGQALHIVADAGESEQLGTAPPLMIEQVFGVDVAIEGRRRAGSPGRPRRDGCLHAI